MQFVGALDGYAIKFWSERTCVRSRIDKVTAVTSFALPGDGGRMDAAQPDFDRAARAIFAGRSD
jgi:hypothetical protein